MALIDFLKANAEFVASGGPHVPSQEGRPTLVIASDHPKLTGTLEYALGLAPGTAVVTRLSGAWGGKEAEELLRSVTMAVYLHDCEEVVVVGLDGDDVCPPSSQQTRSGIKRAGLETRSALAEKIQDLVRGPSSARAGVLDTVRFLRNSDLVPDTVPVHGCLLQLDTGLLSVLDREQSKQESKAPSGAESSPVSNTSSESDFQLPPMPEIPLPEIPDLDLDSLTAPQQQPATIQESKASDYGRKTEGAGPVSFDDIKRQAPVGNEFNPEQFNPEQFNPEQFNPNQFTPAQFTPAASSSPDIQFQVPESAVIQDTGLGDVADMMPGQPKPPSFADPDVQAHDDVEARPDVRAKLDVVADPSVRKKKRQKKRRPQKPTPPRQVERPEVTPIIQAEAQRPLGEREIEFREPAKPKRQSSGTRVDLKAGYVSQDGSEFPLDPELQRAMIKVARFLANEFAHADRNQILGRIRRAANQGQQTGELLKLMIGPVLKLGKKRYAVINELLKIKEDLPRQSGAVALALLEEVLTGS